MFRHSEPLARVKVERSSSGEKRSPLLLQGPSPNFPSREAWRGAGPGWQVLEWGARLRLKRAARCALGSTGTSPPGVGAERVENIRREKRLAAPPSLPAEALATASLQPGGPKGKRGNAWSVTGKRGRAGPWGRRAQGWFPGQGLLSTTVKCASKGDQAFPIPQTKGSKQKSKG